jgi:recombination protein RecT
MADKQTEIKPAAQAVGEGIKNALTEKTGAVAKKKQPATMKDWLNDDRFKHEIARALPEIIKPERFIRTVITAMQTTKNLSSCTTNSFISATLMCAQLGLEPNTPLGRAYLIPYRNHGQLEVQFQVGYRGLIELAWRSDMVTDIQAREVYPNDDFSVEFGDVNSITHHPQEHDENAQPIYYYAVVKIRGGGKSLAVMSHKEVEQFAKKFSKAYNNGPWQTNFDAMAKKTVLKQALKYAPMSVEMSDAIGMDEHIKAEYEFGQNMADMPDIPLDLGEAETVDEGTTSEGEQAT